MPRDKDSKLKWNTMILFFLAKYNSIKNIIIISFSMHSFEFLN